MANEQNLVRGDEAHKLTAEEQSQGGKKSGEVRRKKRDLRLALEQLLEADYKDRRGQTVSGTVAISTRLFEQALKGNIRAFCAIRETVGQDPVQKVEISQTDPEVVAEVEDMVYGKDES